MRHALANESWKNLLPDTHDWLDKVSVTAAGGAKVDGAHHVVAVKTGDEAKDQILLSAPKLDAELQRKIVAAATALNWKPSAGAVHLVVDGAPFTLVPL